jgi:hypothetical protein
MRLMLQLGKMVFKETCQSPLIQKTIQHAEKRGQAMLKGLFNPLSTPAAQQVPEKEEDLPRQLKILQALAAELRVELTEVRNHLQTPLKQQGIVSR